MSCVEAMIVIVLGFEEALVSGEMRDEGIGGAQRLEVSGPYVGCGSFYKHLLSYLLCFRHCLITKIPTL